MKICAICAEFESLGIGEYRQGAHNAQSGNMCKMCHMCNMNNMCRVWKFGYRWVQAGGHTMLSLDSSPLVIPLPAGRAPWSQREPSPPHALQSPHLPPPLPSPPYPASTSSNTPSQPYLFNQHLSSFDSSPRNYIVLYLLIWSFVSLTSSEVEGHEIESANPYQKLRPNIWGLIEQIFWANTKGHIEPNL